MECHQAKSHLTPTPSYSPNYFVKTDAGVAVAPIMNIILIPGRKTTLVKKAKTGKIVKILIFMF